ncbi:MAG: penicillin-binding transpeptidase domain-containing protein [Parachlamydiaceae bacterium]
MRLPTLLWHLFLCTTPLALPSEENFILIDGRTDKPILKMGSNTHARISPCSTFKIALCLMGFEEEILENEQKPAWQYQIGYDGSLDTWKCPHTPQSWMRHSCIWYSIELALHLGPKNIQHYLKQFAYGNQEMPSEPVEHGKNPFWIDGPLAISPLEQVTFITKLINGYLPVSLRSHGITKNFLFQEEFDGWKLFGKTAWSGRAKKDDNRILEHGWFVGWVEKGDQYYPFAYLIQEKNIKLDQRIPRVKELIRTIDLIQ